MIWFTVFSSVFMTAYIKCDDSPYRWVLFLGYMVCGVVANLIYGSLKNKIKRLEENKE